MVSERLILLFLLFLKYHSIYGKTTVAPQNNCECIDKALLEKDLGEIKYTVTDVTEQVSVLKELPNILSKLGNISEAIDNITCQFTNEDTLLESQKSANTKIDEALAIIAKSVECACSNRDRLSSDNQIVLGELEQLGIVTNTINVRSEAYDKEVTEISTKLDTLIASKSEKDNCSKLRDFQDLNTTLQKIEQHVSSIDDTKCRCADQFKVLYDKVCKRFEEILKILNNITQQNKQCHDETSTETLDKMDNKLDLIINNLKIGGTNECDCLKSKQFEEEMPQYCGGKLQNKKAKKAKKGKKKKKEEEEEEEEEVKPWEIPKKAKKKLVSDYEGCIKDAIRDLDDWFEDDAWSRMPTSVKTILISLYCKVGFSALKDEKTKDFLKMKSALEDGKWKTASDRLSKTDWAKKYPDAADNLVDDLKNVKEKMKKG